MFFAYAMLNIICFYVFMFSGMLHYSQQKNPCSPNFCCDTHNSLQINQYWREQLAVKVCSLHKGTRAFFLDWLHTDLYQGMAAHGPRDMGLKLHTSHYGAGCPSWAFMDLAQMGLSLCPGVAGCAIIILNWCQDRNYELSFTCLSSSQCQRTYPTTNHWFLQALTLNEWSLVNRSNGQILQPQYILYVSL